MGGRVLKGSLKEALKGAKGASTMSTNAESSKEKNYFLDEIPSSINMFLVMRINLIACVTCFKDIPFNKTSYVVYSLQGLARTHVPTNRNCEPKVIALGLLAGVSPTLVQWKGLFPGEPPS